MASTEKPSDIIQKARGKLTEALLQIETDLILDVVDAHLFLTQDEYFSLSRMQDPQGFLQNLIDTVLRKGEPVHEQFLVCLKKLRRAFPSLRPLSEYLENSPDNPIDKLHISSTTVFLEEEDNAENIVWNPDSGTSLRVLQKIKMDKNPVPSVCSEARKEVEKPGVDASEDGVERLGAPASCLQEGGQAENLEISVSWEAASRAKSPNICPRRGSDVEILGTSACKRKESGISDQDDSEEQSGTPCSAKRERTEISNHGPVYLKHESKIPSPVVLLMNGAEKLDVALSPLEDNDGERLGSSVPSEVGKEVEKPDDVTVPSGTGTASPARSERAESSNQDLRHEKLDVSMASAGDNDSESQDPSVSSEAGMEVEKPDAVPVPSGTGSKAENPDVILSSTQKNEEKNQVASEDGNGVEKPVAVCPEKERRKALQDMLAKLNLEKNQSKKLSLQEVLEISSEGLKECPPCTVEDLPWHFLRKVLGLNVTARSTGFEKMTSGDHRGNKEKKRTDESIFLSMEIDESVSVNPLDVLCAVLLCSDSFLQQEILSKMSMCQFALPLLLPPLETSHCTLMLWAMRDIVKKWRPHSLADSRGFREESLVLTSMPTISFVRMGSLSLSKSRLLNEFLSPSQQHHDFFIHQDMEGGDVPREIADGLVEIAWYFPGGRKSSDLFPEPLAVGNLHGSIETHQVQFRFLSEVSSAVFIFVEWISKKEYTFLSSMKNYLLSMECYFIVVPNGRNMNETFSYLKDLVPMHKLNTHILMKAPRTNTSKIVEQLRSTVRRIISADPKKVSIDDMAAAARKLLVQVDEDCQECQDARRCTLEITGDIDDVALYKKEMLKLQGDLWKNLAKVEKELCRMEKQGNMPSEKYRSELKGKLVLLRQQQNECDLTIALLNFICCIKDSELAKKQYFLKWMKFNLDHLSRANLSKLRAEYKEKCKLLGDGAQEMAEVDQQISSSSLGIEHFIRELGQFYEAEWLMVREGKVTKPERRFDHFPSIAADLMVEGFPLELIDGDASNIPLQWITDVLSQVHRKLRRRSRMFVVTVLGVQSTGKSTLLNTMFGLQFAVSSGRCTRGAFMTLLKVQENLIQELGCDFILVIDTEGLKAPELAKQGDSYQHDNELATLVIGLSDITIVNMAMENATEMKDILQIVTHAFLRMEKIGQRPNCQFVHQNVSDVSAHDQNMRDRKHLLEQLNEMTLAAAKMEKIDKDIRFSDIMDYDPELHNWYIPGLWHGVPPMASVNRGYSEKVFELRKYLFKILRERSLATGPKDIPQFIKWIKSLWNAVKHENFIFSFRNSLIAEAYNQLSARYSEWDWGFRREMHLWVSEQETLIQNASLEELECLNWENELQQKLLCGEQQILESLEKYFESGASNLHLVEKYREDFVRSANSLKHELESYSYNKCKDAIHIKKGQHKIDALQVKYLDVIEGKVDGLLEECRKEERRLDDEELRREFEKMWTVTLSEISPVLLERKPIHSVIETFLRKDLSHRGSSVNQKVQAAKNLLSYRMNTFQMNSEYINPSFWECVRSLFSRKEQMCKAEEFAKSLMSKCMEYINEKASSRGDYDETYFGELLHIINQRLQEGEAQTLHTSPSFEVDLKLHILGEAAHFFQKMHEDFVKENDPRGRLEKLKPQYFSTFADLYLEKDAHQTRAKNFCDQCLYPALMDYVNKKLGIAIVDNILSLSQSVGYASRSFFQFTVLKELLEERNVNSYVRYMRSYEEFVKSWIMKKLLWCYTEKQSLMTLEKDILSAVVKKIMEMLESLKDKGIQKISQFLEMFRKEMQKELVIPKDSLVGIQFKNMSNPSHFVPCVETFFPDLQKRILSEFGALDLQSKLSKLPVKPQDEIFKRVFGCGKQCPFCKVPCEAGGSGHKEHFAAVHLPKGLGRFRWDKTERLCHELCSTSVVSQNSFKNEETGRKWHPYKDYRFYYPDWCIQPDPSIHASDYWKFVFKEFNHEFAREYAAKPADLPEDWKNITQQQALAALKETYNMK